MFFLHLPTLHYKRFSLYKNEIVVKNVKNFYEEVIEKL